METKKNAPAKEKAGAKTAQGRRPARKRNARKSGGGKTAGKKWSGHVTETSNAMDLKKGIFTSDDPKKIADSVEKSASRSKRKKGTSYQSAMSMLNFYINRAGKNLSATKKKKLGKAKEELKSKQEAAAGSGKK